MRCRTNPRICFLAVISLILCITASQAGASRAIDEYAICTDPCTQQNAAISGNIVVWQDNRNGNEDIYGYDLLNKVEFPICTDTNDQFDPAIDGSIVVWTDFRNGNGDIYGIDMLTNKEFDVCTDTNGQHRPAICRPYVVWEDRRNGSLCSDIYGYDLIDQNEFEVYVDEYGIQQRLPDISGDIVVWNDAYYQAYGYYITDKNKFQLNDAFSDWVNLAIDGRYVVFTDKTTGYDDIYGYDLLTDTNFPISTGTSDRYYPDISGSLVVWNEDGDIYGYDLFEEEEFLICADSNGQSSAAVSGNIVVWQDSRNGNIDIYGANALLLQHNECEYAIVAEADVTQSGSISRGGGETWYSFTPVADSNYTISLCGSDFDTSLSVFDGCGPYANELAANDNNDVCGGGSVQSQIDDIALAEGLTYYIRIAGAGVGDKGNYVLNITGLKCGGAIAGDINNDCRVNWKDFAIIAEDWLQDNIQ